MKISFVIPAYNEEDYIRPCLESVMGALATGAYEAEVIVVNNASTDRTRELALCVQGVTVVDEDRKGIVWARQAGFLASTGDLIANLDADTRLPPGWIDTVLREFERNDKLAALTGPQVHYDMSLSGRAIVMTFYAMGYLTNLVVQHVLHAGAMVQGGNFVLRRSILEAMNGFDTTIDFYGEDSDVGRRASRFGRVKWTFRLPIYSSARRLDGEGMVRVGMRYAVNHFWVTFRGKPLTTTSTDVRPK
ncbi:MAG: glycosyltransferase family 2 protein [Bauldia sp.]|nr:glycosyltransferase family 2 protein [Bauldia sp.]